MKTQLQSCQDFFLLSGYEKLPHFSTQQNEYCRDTLLPLEANYLASNSASSKQRFWMGNFSLLSGSGLWHELVAWVYLNFSLLHLFSNSFWDKMWSKSALHSKKNHRKEKTQFHACHREVIPHQGHFSGIPVLLLAASFPRMVLQLPHHDSPPEVGIQL